MKARLGLVFAVASLAMMMTTTLPGCPWLFPTPTPTPTPTPEKQATLPGGAIGYRIEAPVPGRAAPQ